jgi:hypothetical protein
MLCVVLDGNNQSQGDMLSLDSGALDRVSCFFEDHWLMEDGEWRSMRPERIDTFVNSNDLSPQC